MSQGPTELVVMVLMLVIPLIIVLGLTVFLMHRRQARKEHRSFLGDAVEHRSEP